MKTARYYIEFDMIENEMCDRIEISKATYNHQMKFLKQQTVCTMDTEYPVEQPRTIVQNHAECIETRTWFVCGCATPTLIELKCLPGRCFAAKK